MGYIFVSYAGDERKRVFRILDRLKKHGLQFWVDKQDLETGKYWDEEISKAIRNCSKFFLLMSRLSMASKDVSKEVKIASGNNKKVIILRLDEVNLPDKFKYALEGIQWTDYSSSQWETKIVSALDGKLFRKSKTSTIRTGLSIKSPPKRPRGAKSVILGLVRKFSQNRVYYEDECDAAISQLDELQSVAGAHWINPILAFKELVSRQYLLGKIEDIQNLIRDFQKTGSSIKRELIHNELKTLYSELNRKADR